MVHFFRLSRLKSLSNNISVETVCQKSLRSPEIFLNCQSLSGFGVFTREATSQRAFYCVQNVCLEETMSKWPSKALIELLLLTKFMIQ